VVVLAGGDVVDGVVDVVAALVVVAAVVAGACVDDGGVTVVESLQPATMRPSVATRPRNRR
jgi:hypothetical protein